MKFKLSDVASIQTGVFAKGKSNGEIVYLQVKHFDENGKLLSDLLPELPAMGIVIKHLLNPGDVLFAAKGNKNFAAVFESHKLTAVASTSFFVIRLKEKNVLPAYIAWFLNNPSTLTCLKKQAIGTSLPSITKQVLEALEVNIPEMKKQKAILKIVTLQEKEKKIKMKLELLRESIIQHRITNAIK